MLRYQMNAIAWKQKRTEMLSDISKWFHIRKAYIIEQHKIKINNKRILLAPFMYQYSK